MAAVLALHSEPSAPTVTCPAINEHGGVSMKLAQKSGEGVVNLAGTLPIEAGEAADLVGSLCRRHCIPDLKCAFSKEPMVGRA